MYTAATSLALFAAPIEAQLPDRTPAARTFLDALVREDFVQAAAGFDAKVLAALPAEKLGQTWRALLAQAGGFQRQSGVRVERAGGFDVVILVCQFEKAALDMRVAFDSAGKIGGLFFGPSAPAESVLPASLREAAVTVGSGDWALPGTLTMPAGTGPFAAVVLVHGSGPNDRDETIGPNKPFRDLARGLANRGVAVLRYEKRTRVYGARFAGSTRFTVREETIDDAIAATRLLLARTEIDPKRVYVLGHSLGGMLIPRIATDHPEIAGLIVMAGTTRPLEDVILEQLQYLGQLPENQTAEGRTQMEALRQGAERVKLLTNSDSASAELFIGAPAAYWLDLRGYDPPAVAAQLPQRMLILQGERDYQVTMEDFRRWREGLRDKPGVTYKSYPTLNHLFIAGRGKSVPAEYNIAGTVSSEVLDDIATWINRP